jgi:hypothetical protein
MSIQDQRDRQQRDRLERQARFQRQSPVFELRDSHVANAIRTLPEKYRAGYQTEAADQDAVLQGFLKRYREIMTSPSLTETGRQEALAKELKKAITDSSARRARVETRLGTEVKHRTGGVLAKAGETKEDPAVRYWRHREIRDYVAGLDPLMVPTALQAAIDRGQGFDWLAALDAAVVPVHAELIAETRAKLVEAADPELAALAELQRAHELTVNFTDAGLREVAMANGVDFTALSAPEGVTK